jgi:hypothetical protein
MKWKLAPLSLILLGACASPQAESQAEQAAERDALVQAKLDSLQAQLEQLLIQTRMDPPALPGFTIIPPLRVDKPDFQLDQEMLKQKLMIDALLAEALEQQKSQGAELRRAQLPTLIETDYGPGFVPASPEITLKEVDGDTITLNVSTNNPIGGPTVHHYQLKKVDGVWVGSYVGSTEYL